MMLLQRTYPDRPPFRVVELQVGDSADSEVPLTGLTPLRRVTDRPVA
jgi:hypothetical protein